MNQLNHTAVFVMNYVMGNPWPTPRPCKRAATPEGGILQGRGQPLAQLSNVDSSHPGWILFIAPPGRPTIVHLEEHGIDPARVLIVHSSKIKNWQQTLERSLSSGHCAALFTWIPEQVELDHAKLQRLGRQAGVLTCFFDHKRPMSTTPDIGSAMRDLYLNH